LDELVQDSLIAKTPTETTESNFRRTQKLADEGIAPERRLIEERGRYREANTRYQHMREKLLALGMTPDELRALERASHEESHRYLLKSPIAGTVVKQNVVLGQGVSPEKELFEVVDTTHVWVFAHLPIEQASQLKPGDPGTIVRKGGDTVPTVLRDISPVADDTTRTIRVRFDVPNPEQRLKPNEYVQVHLAKGSTSLLAIPATAITLIEKTRGAFVVRDNGYAFVPLEVGREEGEWAEIRKGLREGDKVVTSGVFDLKSVLMKETIQTGEED
jgi:cobalt-zinc-cadmium efflux system membrane fusion protein